MKGRMMYVPERVFRELNVLKETKGYQGKYWRTKAFDALVDSSRIGRELEGMYTRGIGTHLFGRWKTKREQKRKR